jgi:GDPmannose 4,6-dehydratase
MKALICGISGQDGAYLAQLLLKKGYEVYGSSRDADSCKFGNLQKLGIDKDVNFVSIALKDFRSVFQAISNIQPNEVYNLAGQSSVGLSFEQPVETMESISLGTINLLEAIRIVDKNIRFYSAGSSECFGNTQDFPADENSVFRPRSPYAVAKAAAFWSVANYREAHDLFACTGILFNHESPLRSDKFVTKKIVNAAVSIKSGSGLKLKLGNIEIQRDWGWAPEYVNAMWLMLNHSVPDDFVIATGKASRLKDFVDLTFTKLGLDWRQHVEVDEKLFRPTDLQITIGNPSKAKKVLSWESKLGLSQIIGHMITAAERETHKGAI